MEASPQDRLQLRLPGGLLRAGRLARSATLGPLNGHVEEALCDWREGRLPGPQAVDQVLGAARLQLDGEPAQAGTAPALCVGDRHWLMIQLLRQLTPQPWLSAPCPACGQVFDLPVALDRLPCSEAGPGFPWVHTTLADQALCLRVPTGADQAAIVGLAPDRAALALLQACLVSVAGAPPPPDWVDGLSPPALRQLDDALDATAPQVATALHSHCPQCDQPVTVHFDLATLATLSSDQLLDEVCTLARVCHWREHDILAMPRARRLRYLDRIERAPGWAE